MASHLRGDLSLEAGSVWASSLRISGLPGCPLSASSLISGMLSVGCPSTVFFSLRLPVVQGALTRHLRTVTNWLIWTSQIFLIPM